MVTCIGCFILLYKYLKEKPNYIELFFKTILSTIVMAIGIKITIYVLGILNVGNMLTTIITIVCAVIIYSICIIKFKTLSKEEYLEFPMGEKIYKIAKSLAK